MTSRHDHLGVGRTVEPPGALPYEATRLDPSTPLRAGELLVDVESLNIDSASWTQLRGECVDDAGRLAARVLEIVRGAGKMHNPVTGSGGMLIGRVAALGSGRTAPAIGTRVCSLVSLTCTPLALDEIVAVDPASPQVRVRGRAVLFESSALAEVPDDVDDAVTLAVMDVVGAPGWATRLARPGMRVVVIGGGGKAGLLSVAACAERVGPEGRVLALCWPPESVAAARAAGAEAVAVDCTNAVAVMDTVTARFDGGLADLVLSCANVGGCEGGAILACADDGEVVFFSMATSFAAAALISEALGRRARMTIGSGYVPEYVDAALELVRRRPELIPHLSH
jgi:L-erythro-3,5-diaminohexanoate dehydrogenase